VTRLVRWLVPAALVAVAAVTLLSHVGAQPAAKPYEFKLGDKPLSDEDARKVTLRPAFKAVADDKFEYEVYLDKKTNGGSSDGAAPAGGFARRETWMALCEVLLEEDELNGRKDLRAAFRFGPLHFDLSDGEESFSGYIGPGGGDAADRKDATFWKIERDGSRTQAFNIPGWAGVNARGVESSRNTQSMIGNAAAWMSISESGRAHSELYFAEFDVADQRNYPGRFLDPVQLLLGIQPEFAPDASVQAGGTLSVRRRFPVGLSGSLDYDLTYTLEKIYGTVETPTAAVFKFTGKPVTAEQAQRLGGLDVRYTAPEITDGYLLLDLVKGVAAVVKWKYALKGEVLEPGSARKASFASAAEFSASLRKQQK